MTLRTQEIRLAGGNFDKDLERLNEIRNRERTAADCDFLISFIDCLWQAYSTEGRKLDECMHRQMQCRCCGATFSRQDGIQ